ncbi:hypothetical protein FOE78_15155 [Microlunatus elymi]|uniref:Uncharacterized protein n=1 Tax=Microlunatus elymi TaxID=2596828 RepID=A0A516Q0X2_9ACTN|nr:hypothetical protein [Microlunatus elymi]QDP97085.1 hypothetical protein FOE78_15155 [Microlunatus elymi]
MLIDRRVALLLGGAAEDDLAELLGSLLLVSVGRPWKPLASGLTDVSTTVGADAVLITGRVDDLVLRATLTPTGDRLAIRLDWRQGGDDVLRDVVLGLLLPAPAGARITIPQVIHHDNPSVDPERTVPHVGRGGFVTQTHRLPIPAVCAERAGEAVILAADVSSDALVGGWDGGSLGAASDPDRTVIIAAGGAIMFDGRPDVDYVHKQVITEHQAGYRDLQPGDQLRQGYLIERTRITPPGQGFRRLTAFADDLFPPGLPDAATTLSRGRTIELKTSALDARWFADGDVAGYLKFPAWGEPRNKPGRPDHDFLYGWTGQCLRLAWCDARLGLRNDEPERLRRCRQVVEFYLRGSATAVDGMRLNHYVHDDRRWGGFRLAGAPMISARAHGETLVDLAEITELFRDAGKIPNQDWIAAVVSGADFVLKTLTADGVVPIGWRTDGTPIQQRRGFAGVPAAHAVAWAHRLSGEQRFRDAAIELAEAYHRLPGPGFERPYAFATLDAACEDKESGLGYLRFLIMMHELTADARYLERACGVADWLLTWVYHWSPEQPAGSILERAGFRARGWPGVSVQNHHLDVYFPTHALWRLGRLTGQDRFCRWAIEVDVALRQGICTRPGEWGFEVAGEQTEAFFVTDWQQRGAANTWNPSWVIALPLWQALLLEADHVLDPVG